ncbi:MULTISPECIES: hypothetical protein [Pontibacillus]|uniref:Uncharacterized protein n=1 Tax=Pontibacillus chungwhensis TaxID=265426 RepID=A0ABY8UTJ8_9BACI|nr:MULTISPECIES: hypothetical protein [Pontibacillus]MCD5323252.1 hypothetical protein [Pontibacillus sp. HN14]WIF96638.1 hypothetical protein QNI29_12845 [Pontibacillus chungwhensis]
MKPFKAHLSEKDVVALAYLVGQRLDSIIATSTSLHVQDEALDEYDSVLIEVNHQYISIHNTRLESEGFVRYWDVTKLHPSELHREEEDEENVLYHISVDQLFVTEIRGISIYAKEVETDEVTLMIDEMIVFDLEDGREFGLVARKGKSGVGILFEADMIQAVAENCIERCRCG